MVTKIFVLFTKIIRFYLFFEGLGLFWSFYLWHYVWFWFMYNTDNCDYIILIPSKQTKKCEYHAVRGCFPHALYLSQRISYEWYNMNQVCILGISYNLARLPFTSNFCVKTKLKFIKLPLRLDFNFMKGVILWLLCILLLLFTKNTRTFLAIIYPIKTTIKYQHISRIIFYFQVTHFIVITHV